MVDVDKKYRKLDEIEHILIRPGRYVGSVSPHTSKTWIIKDNQAHKVEVTYSPAALKLFDEAISNSVDHSKTKEGKHLNEIRVDVNPLSGHITVYDNGGIPVQMHKEGLWVPELLFGELRAGSNFDDHDDSTSTGQNGEGISLAAVLSEEFEVTTSDGKKKFNMTFSNNSRQRTKPKITKSTKHFTQISFVPDWKVLSCECNDDFISMVETRTHEIAATNPHLKVFFNGKQIKYKSFSDYVSLFVDHPIHFSIDRWNIALGLATDGFEHVSFVNSTRTYVGGSHVDTVAGRLVDAIRQHVEKKTKQKVKPADIKSHFFLFIDSTISNPRYDSQTKERLITEWSQYGSTFDIPDKFIKQVIKSDVVEEIIEWAERKKELEDMKALRDKQKKDAKENLKNILKFDDATQKSNRHECSLFIAEGISAGRTLLAARDPKTMGVYPLKGKILNVRDVRPSKVVLNEEVSSILRIIGLRLGEPFDKEKCRFGKIVITTDADFDGKHILGLLYNLFQTYWPEMCSSGMIYMLNTPLIKVTYRKKIYELFNKADFDEWFKSKGEPKCVIQYVKGLGGHDTQDFKKYLNNEEYFVNITYDGKEDKEKLDLVFDKNRANDRKEWLAVL